MPHPVAAVAARARAGHQQPHVLPMAVATAQVGKAAPAIAAVHQLGREQVGTGQLGKLQSGRPLARMPEAGGGQARGPGQARLQLQPSATAQQVATVQQNAQAGASVLSFKRVRRSGAK